MKTVSYILIFLAVCLFSCKKANRFALKGSEINANTTLQIQRFDSALIMLDTADIHCSIDKLYADFPQFTPSFVKYILNESPADTAAVAALLQDFLRDTTFQRINQKTLSVYKNVSALEKELTQAFNFLHHYFPKITMPEIYFFVSGFNRNILLEDNTIGVGVDLYLGSDEPLYEEIVYQYMTVRMRPECLSSEIVSAVLYDVFPVNNNAYRLLDNMLEHGKRMYLLASALPDVKPNDLIAYTKFQWEWSRKYESEIWESIVSQQHLYSSEDALIRKYTGDAPFTAPISQDSPARLGVWIGWQIINSYMTQNKQVTLPELMQENDYQKILELADYHP
ncbi:MAG: hypothetical protein LBN23_05790 [Paludibacter sp.]|jgi:hypothetical protein|nr:hypothetical protein [Paludibacter sp.]